MGLHTNENINWWDPPSDDYPEEYVASCRANSLIEHMRNLEMTHRAVHESNIFAYELYANRMLACFDWGTGTLTAASLEPLSQVTDNVVLEIVNALYSEIGKARPIAKPIGHGASWRSRQNIRKLTKFIAGEFVRNKVWDKIGKKALLDAEVCQFGCVKITADDDGGATYTKVFPDNILIDQQEVVATGEIWHVIERRVLPIEVVAATYDVDIEELKHCATTLDNYIPYRSIGKNYIVVGEAYRKGSKDNPGRHITVVADKILEDEEWPHEFLPYVFFHWTDPLVGFYCQSAVEQILPDQVRLNELNDVIRKAQDIMCSPHIAAQLGSVDKNAITNAIGNILFYKGTKPEALTWPAVNADLYNERISTRANAFRKMGINESAASGNAPARARLDSAPALRELSQVQDGRLSDVTQRYENLYLDIAEITIRVIKASGKNPKTICYTGPGNKVVSEVIHWKDIDIDKCRYTMQLQAASSFSMTPSAIRDDLEAKLARGEITAQEYAQQLQSPDPDSAVSLLAAAADAIDFLLEEIESGKLVSVTPQYDLENLELRLTQFYNSLARFVDEDGENDVPVEVYESCIDAMEQTKNWIAKGAESPPDMAMAPPVAAPPMQQPMMGPV